MNFFLIIYCVVIDSTEKYYGKVALTSMYIEHDLGELELKLMECYKNMFPTTECVYIFIMEKNRITPQQYNEFAMLVSLGYN